MAAFSLRQREPSAVKQFIKDFTGSHRYIMDHLVDEGLQHQPIEVQAFLLYTSILKQFCAPLCEAIFRESETVASNRDFTPLPGPLDIRRVQDLLAYLEHAKLFIAPLDHQRYWYRYHHLFVELLRHRLNQAYADQVNTLHLRASQWYEQTGLTGPALRQALAMLPRVELARLLSWLEALPEEEVQARPLLALCYAWNLFLSGQIQQAAAGLETVEARLAMDEAKRTPEVQAQIATMRAYLTRETSDFVATLTLSREALTSLPEEETLLRAMGFRMKTWIAILRHLWKFSLLRL